MIRNSENQKLIVINLNPSNKHYTYHVNNLKRNILIIRDTFKAVFTTSAIGIDSSMNVFYSATGLSDSKSEEDDKIATQNKQANDNFRNMLNSKKITSNENYIKLATAFVDAGLPEEYICASEIKLFNILKSNKATTQINNSTNYSTNIGESSKQYSIADLVNFYFAPTGVIAPMGKKDVSDVLPNRLLLDFLAGDKDLLLIVTVCLRLITRFIKTDEHVLFQTSEALKSVIHGNELFNGTEEEKDILFDSTEFTNYLVQLADNVIAVEQEFPDFYNLIQQRKKKNSIDISARSIMNEINLKLNELNKQLTADDINSDTFIAMMKQITDTMLNVNNTLEAMHEEAQTQLLLKLSQSE